MRSEEARVWNEILRMDQIDICKRTLATLSPDTNSFRLSIMDEEYAIKFESRRMVKILKDGGEEEADWMSRLLILQHILNAKDIPFSNRLKSPCDFKGGDLFFSAPTHRVSYEPLLQKYGSPQEFLNAGLSHGGRPISYADAAFELKLLPRVPIAYLFWSGDEEFPSRISVLLDETAEQQLPMDALWVGILAANRRMLEWDERALQAGK